MAFSGRELRGEIVVSSAADRDGALGLGAITLRGNEGGEVATADQEWLDVQQLVQVEVTSEDAAHPVEAALVPGDGAGWRAAQPGEQTLRLVFDRPQRLGRASGSCSSSPTRRARRSSCCPGRPAAGDGSARSSASSGTLALRHDPRGGGLPR